MINHHNLEERKLGASRRSILALGKGMVAATVLPPGAFGRTAEKEAKPGGLRKFTTKSQISRTPGNPAIFHLPQQVADSAPFGTLLDFYRQAHLRPYGRKVPLGNSNRSDFHRVEANIANQSQQSVGWAFIPNSWEVRTHAS